MGKAIEEFAATTTIHGVQTYLMAKRRWFKVIWGLLMVASILAMVAQLYQTSKEYSRAPVTSSTSFEAPDQWPTITICPDKWFNASKAFDPGFNASDVQLITLVLWPYTDFSVEAANETLTYLSGRKADFSQIMAKANLTTIEDMVEVVTGNVVESYGPNYELVQLVKTPYSRKAGSKVCFYSSNVPPNYENLDFSIDGGGFFTVTRNPSPYGKKYDFKPGNGVVVKITMEGTSLLPKPTNPCILNMDETVCTETCSLEHDKCFVSPWNFPHMYTLEERFDSLAGFNYYNLTNHNDTAWEKCDKDNAMCVKGCHSCDNWKFEIDVQAEEYPYLDNFSLISIKMEQNVKMIRESWAYTETMLVSNVGGLVSLYLGASILSVAHLCFFCLSRCFNKKPQEVMTAEEGRISPMKTRKKDRWTKLIWPSSRKKSVQRRASAPWVLHISNFNKDCVTQT